MKTLPVPISTSKAKAHRFRARFIALLQSTEGLPPQLRMMLGPFIPMLKPALESMPDAAILGILEQINQHLRYVNTGE